jgi:Zn ribbon nucleic-acid-binding protein
MNLYEKPLGQILRPRYNRAQKVSRKRTVTGPHMASPCKHPRVRIVSRQDDVEYVECLECGEVFDSDEFRDMQIEEEGEKEVDD